MRRLDLERLVPGAHAADELRPERRSAHRDALREFRTVAFSLELPASGRLLLERRVRAVPLRAQPIPRTRDQRCDEVYQIQVQGLVKRLRVHRASSEVVIGVSGGLDSTQALLVCAQAMDLLGYPRDQHPGLHHARLRHQRRARSSRPTALMQAVGCEAHEIDIRPSCAADAARHRPSLRARASRVYDVTFENVQAGERTSHLFRLANHHGALVVGTGDLSELALGWCTYGVGDHMSHYNVNASVPKTLIQHLIRWVAETRAAGRRGERGAAATSSHTEISPELVPGDGTGSRSPRRTPRRSSAPTSCRISTSTTPLRFGYAPPKVAFLAYCAWRDRDQGRWPDIPLDQRHQYDIGEIKR